ncbi:MAG: hypothetical protein LBJ93_01595 [Clostridiales bacterium]|jgi:hypothetical protein|nr:hypothetical protein [Clostridiales bacterium]
MVKKLTSPKITIVPERLTSNIERKFIVSFGRKLQKGFNFEFMEKSDNKKFQKFLDIASGHTVSEMEKYRQRPDKTDEINGEQIQHYKLSDKFRIHGVFIDERFEVYRIDPKHKFHN